jgi:hypothetical protein
MQVYPAPSGRDASRRFGGGLLIVGVDQEHVVSLGDEHDGEVGGDGRLARPALGPAYDGDHRYPLEMSAMSGGYPGDVRLPSG